MRGVGAFVRERRAGWERLEGLAARAASGRLAVAEVEALDRLYRRAAGDLAAARSAFPGSDAEAYLSQLTARAFAVLYGPRRGAWGTLRALLAEEAPAAFRRHVGALGLAGLFLGAWAAAGALAIAADPGAAGLLVPEQVRDAVARGQLWTEPLLDAAPGISGSQIAHNNVTVASLAFALGLTAGLGTAALLFANGLLLGAVFAHAAGHGMAGQLLGFVAAHGPAELSALLLAAQGGFVLAGAIVDPGEWPRAQALSARGRDAARLLAVVVPLLAAVALVEATVSPGDRFPAPAKGALGIALAAALWAFLARGGRAAAGGAPQRR